MSDFEPYSPLNDVYILDDDTVIRQRNGIWIEVRPDKPNYSKKTLEKKRIRRAAKEAEYKQRKRDHQIWRQQQKMEGAELEKIREAARKGYHRAYPPPTVLSKIDTLQKKIDDETQRVFRKRHTAALEKSAWERENMTLFIPAEPENHENREAQ